jgi:hypothetical protein
MGTGVMLALTCTVKSCTLESHVLGHDPVVFGDTSLVILRSHLVAGFFLFFDVEIVVIAIKQ